MKESKRRWIWGEYSNSPHTKELHGIRLSKGFQILLNSLVFFDVIAELVHSRTIGEYIQFEPTSRFWSLQYHTISLLRIFNRRSGQKVPFVLT